MTKFFIGTLGAIFTVIAAAFGVVAVTGGASASGSPTTAATDPAGTPAPDVKSPPTELAVAIGQLTEDDGDSATVDLRASNRRDEAPVGTLRFYSEDDGYYNGGVHDFTCDNGVITANGGGGLVKPDGSRVAVVYQATFNTTTDEATVHVRGRGIDYTLDGHVDGLVWCGDPTKAPPSVPTS